MRSRPSRLACLCIAGTALTAMPMLASLAHAAAPQIVAPVNDRVTLPLSGDLSSAVKRATDAGAIADTTALPHIRLELKRPAALQAAFDRLVLAQHTKGSAQYRHWLQPSDLRSYGPAQADIDKVSLWLTSHGMTVNSVALDGMSIDFGGSAAAVARAFHTSLHAMTLNGEAHIANVSAPAIPAALAPAVVGVTLHNFFPKPMLTKITPGYTSTGANGTFYAVAPADFNTIYNVNPLLGSNNEFHQPITGAGITIAVVEQTKIKTADWNRFRTTFGLSTYAGTLTQIHPGQCAGPGYTGDEVEAAIDAEWASAPAPDAAILEASCATLPPLYFGVETSLQNLVTYPTPATVLSISYGGPELSSGYAFIQGWTNLVEEGDAEGKAIFVSSGDSGSSFDRGVIDQDGLGVNGLSDSAYVTSVGGTDFLDTSLGQNAMYWHAKNSPTGQSALSYVPETPWNNSCADSTIYKYAGFASAGAACNSTTPPIDQNGVGGTGGQSIYATKPSFQLTTIPGMPNDGARDQPDVSLFAANGIWGHFYIICMSDAAEGGSPCDYKNQNDLFGNAYGGTSVSAPAFAGITALIQQVSGPTGNPATTFYQIAAGQFSNTTGLAPCNASLGNMISTACAFNIVTAGSNVEPCVAGSPSCAAPVGDALGQLVQPAIGPGPAFHAGLGYSLATGLGTANATNLLYNFYGTYTP